jgi:hypothetical protein
MPTDRVREHDRVLGEREAAGLRAVPFDPAAAASGPTWTAAQLRAVECAGPA